MRFAALCRQGLARRIAQQVISAGYGRSLGIACRNYAGLGSRPLGAAGVRCVSTSAAYRDAESQSPLAAAPSASTAPTPTEPSKGKKRQAKAPAPEVDPIDLVDLRVGIITNVEPHPDASSLYILQVDVGETDESSTPTTRTIVSGLVKFYKAEELLHKRAVVFANIKPSKLRGIKSEGMLLAASNIDADEVVVELLEVPQNVVPGESVVAAPVVGDAGSEEPTKSRLHKTTLKNKNIIGKFISGLLLTSGTAGYNGRPLQTSQGIAAKPKTMLSGKIS